MPGPVTRSGGFGDAALARRVMEVFASEFWRGSIEEEEVQKSLDEIGIHGERGEELANTLDRVEFSVAQGWDFFYPSEEWAYRNAGFSEEFIRELADSGRRHFLQERMKWYQTHLLREGTALSIRNAMIDGMWSLRAEAKKLIPLLLEAQCQEETFEETQSWRVVDTLHSLTNDEDPLTRASLFLSACVRTCDEQQWDKEEIIEKFRAILNDEDSDARECVIRASDYLGPFAVAVFPELMRLLGGKDAQIAELALMALKAMDEEPKRVDAAAMDVVIGICRDRAQYGDAAQACSDLVFHVLSNAQFDEEAVRKLVLRSGLGVFYSGTLLDNAGRSLMVSLTRLLHDPDPRVRELAIDVLENPAFVMVGAYQALPDLVYVAQYDSAEQCRLRAKEAIGSIEDLYR